MHARFQQALTADGVNARPRCVSEAHGRKKRWLLRPGGSMYGPLTRPVCLGQPQLISPWHEWTKQQITLEKKSSIECLKKPPKSKLHRFFQLANSKYLWTEHFLSGRKENCVCVCWWLTLGLYWSLGLMLHFTWSLPPSSTKHICPTSTRWTVFYYASSLAAFAIFSLSRLFCGCDWWKVFRLATYIHLNSELISPWSNINPIKLLMASLSC